MLPPEPTNSAELIAFAEELEQIATRLRASAILMSQNPACEPLYVYMRQTLEIGIRYTRNYANEVETSYRKWRQGKPVEPESQRNPRAVKKGPKPTKKKG